jgi:hypothetical protein
MRRLEPEEIECRVSQVSEKGCSLLLYKTARVDRAILEESFGNHWQNDFKVIDGKMYGGIGIYDKELKEWLWRWDCGTESNTEAEKGQASDCFKRAGFKWGIGVELYTAPFIWASVDTKKNEKGKWELSNKFTKFYVKNIGYDNKGTINNLVIVDDKGNNIFNLGKKAEKPKAKMNKDDAYIYITLAKIDNVEDIKGFYEINKENVNDREQFHILATERIKAIKAIKQEGVLI